MMSYNPDSRDPASVSCHLCGQSFLVSSIRVHSQACAQNRLKVIDRLVELGYRTRKQDHKLPDPPIAPVPNSAAHNVEDLCAAFSREAMEIYHKHTMPCPHCRRGFEPRALLDHAPTCHDRNIDKDPPYRSNTRRTSQTATPKQRQYMCNICGSMFDRAKLIEHRPGCEAEFRTKYPHRDVPQMTIEEPEPEPVHMPVQDSSPRLPPPPATPSFNAPSFEAPPPYESPKPDRREQQPRAEPTEQVKVEADGRIACKFCGRKFAAERINRHEEICNKLATKAASSPAAKKTPMTKSKSPAPTKPRQPGRATTGDGRVVCRYCGRGFNGDRISAHEDICQKVENRPAGRPKTSASPHVRSPAKSKPFDQDSPLPSRPLPGRSPPSASRRTAPGAGGVDGPRELWAFCPRCGLPFATSRCTRCGTVRKTF